jgi:hypothetical protein
VLPTTFLNDASPSDEEEEQRLFTQPEAEAEDIDLMVEPHLGISSWRLTKLLMLFLPHCHPHAAKN